MLNDDGTIVRASDKGSAMNTSGDQAGGTNSGGSASGTGAATDAETAGDLATTGGSFAWIALGSALVLALAGASLMLFSRARSATS